MGEAMKRFASLARLRVAEKGLARLDRSLCARPSLAWRLHRQRHPLAEYRVCPLNRHQRR